jgi:hypothetical protein
MLDIVAKLTRRSINLGFTSNLHAEAWNSLPSVVAAFLVPWYVNRMEKLYFEHIFWQDYQSYKSRIARYVGIAKHNSKDGSDRLIGSRDNHDGT